LLKNETVYGVRGMDEPTPRKAGGAHAGKRRREKKPLPHARQREKISRGSNDSSPSDEERKAIWSQFFPNKQEELLFGMLRFVYAGR